MAQKSPDLCFGIEVNGQRARHWRVRSGAHKPELFVERENLARVTHVSLHASGQWHLKANGRETHRWIKPPEITPGFTRALVIVQPVAVATVTQAAPPNTRLIAVSPEAEPTHFNVFIERPGVNLQSWPGKNAQGSVLVGRIPLARSAGWCCVVAHQEPIVPGSTKIPRPSEEELVKLRDAATARELYVTLVAGQSDGTVALIDSRFSPGPQDGETDGG